MTKATAKQTQVEAPKEQDVFILTPQESIQIIIDEWARENGQMAKVDLQLGSERILLKAAA